MTTLYISPGELSRKSAETEGENDYNDDDQDDGRSISPLSSSFLPSFRPRPLFYFTDFAPQGNEMGRFRKRKWIFLHPGKEAESEDSKRKLWPLFPAKLALQLEAVRPCKIAKKVGKKKGAKKGAKLPSFSPWHLYLLQRGRRCNILLGT